MRPAEADAAGVRGGGDSGAGHVGGSRGSGDVGGGGASPTSEGRSPTGASGSRATTQAGANAATRISSAEVSAEEEEDEGFDSEDALCILQSHEASGESETEAVAQQPQQAGSDCMGSSEEQAVPAFQEGGGSSGSSARPRSSEARKPVTAAGNNLLAEAALSTPLRPPSPGEQKRSAVVEELEMEEIEEIVELRSDVRKQPRMQTVPIVPARWDDLEEEELEESQSPPDSLHDALLSLVSSSTGLQRHRRLQQLTVADSDEDDDESNSGPATE